MVDVVLNMGDNFILGNKVTPIEDSYDKTEKYRSVVERYFTIRYVLNLGTILGDYAVMFHSNRICVITLAPTHSLIAKNQTVVKADFQVSVRTNRLTNSVVGKWKRGAQIVENPSNLLFYAECADGSSFGICGCIPGKIIEINKELVNDPNIMIRDPWGKGYIAVILPTVSDYERLKNTMLTDEQLKSVDSNC